METQEQIVRFSAATFSYLASLLLAYSLNLPVIPSRSLFSTYLIVKCSVFRSGR